MKTYTNSKYFKAYNRKIFECLEVLNNGDNKKKQKCMCPDCNEKAINSHTITRKWLADLNENGENEKTIGFSKIPLYNLFARDYRLRNASSSPLFCINCDQKLFKVFESDIKGEKDLIKKSDMLLYRILCKKLFMSQNKKNKSDFILKNNNDNEANIIRQSIFDFKKIEQNQNEKIEIFSENEYDTLQKHKEKMDNYLQKNEIFIDYAHIIIPLNGKKLGFAFSELFINEKEKYNFVSINYLIHQKKEYVVISSNKEIYEKILLLTRQISEKNKINRLIEYIFKRGENIFSSKKFITNLTIEQYALLESLFYNKFKFAEEIKEIKDLNNKNNINLIDNFYYSDSYQIMSPAKIHFSEIKIKKPNEDFLSIGEKILENINRNITKLHFNNFKENIENIQFNDAKKYLKTDYEDKKNIENNIDFLYSTLQYKKIVNFIKKRLDKTEHNEKNIQTLMYLLKNIISSSYKYDTEITKLYLQKTADLVREYSLDIPDFYIKYKYQTEITFVPKINWYENGEKIIETFKNNFSIKKLIKQEAIDYETKILQHCISPDINKELADNNYRIFSLRNEQNEPCATIEIYNKRIINLKGHRNNIPEEKYMKTLLPWLIKEKFENIPWKEIKYYYENDIKKTLNNIEIIENIDFEKEENEPRIKKSKSYKFGLYYGFKNNINYDFNLNILDKAFFKIDENKSILEYHIKNDITEEEKIYVTRYLTNKYIKNIPLYKLEYFIDNNISQDIYSIYNLPTNITLNCNLNLTKCNIDKIPENFKINGNIIISKCKTLKYFPENISCKKIYIDKSQINLIKENIDCEKINIILKGEDSEFHTKKTFFEKYKINKEKIMEIK